MHAILVRIGKAEPVSVGNSLGKSQSEPGGTVFLRALIEPVENAALIQRRIPAVRDDQFVFCQCQCHCTALRAVHERVLDDVSDQNRGKSLIHPDNDRLIRNLSKGYRQRVGIAQAILGDPDIIILDEPTVGLDPRQITEIRELIQKLGENKTVILSSHILGEVQAVCERLLILSKGKLVACDTPANLEKQMSSASALEIDVCASREQAEKLLSRLPNVQSFKSKGTADRCQVRLETEKEHLEDLSKAAFFALAEAGTPLLAMTPTKASLEDIFLELTEGKEPEA